MSEKLMQLEENQVLLTRWPRAWLVDFSRERAVCCKTLSEVKKVLDHYWSRPHTAKGCPLCKTTQEVKP